MEAAVLMGLVGIGQLINKNNKWVVQSKNY